MSGLLPALRPRPRPTSGRWLVATAVVGAVCVGAGIGVFTTAALMERELSPLVFALPAPQVTQVVAPAEPAPAWTPTPCGVSDADPDPARWTIGEEHVGPFSACDSEALDLEATRAALPALAITPVPDAMGAEYRIAFEGRHELRLRAGQGGPYIAIEGRAIATPWGTRVGDRLRSVRARHRDLQCHYGAADGDESLTCFRSAEPDFGPGDGWRDSLQYDVDARRLTHAQREALAAGGMLPVEAFDELVVKAIRWAPSSRR